MIELPEACADETSLSPLEFYNTFTCGHFDFVTLDIRAKEDFVASHVLRSLSFSIDAADVEKSARDAAVVQDYVARLRKTLQEVFWMCRLAVVNEDGTWGPKERFLKQLLVAAGKSSSLVYCSTIIGGIEALKRSFPFIVTSPKPIPKEKAKEKEEQSKDGEEAQEDDDDDDEDDDECLITGFPSVILDDFLYLGDWQAANNKEVLEKLGIGRIVNCTPHENAFKEDDAFRYYQIAIQDSYTQTISDHFEAASSFIEQAEKESQKVLIHCEAG
ncbi:Dual specificity protein phosphatase 5, variant 2 [Balamuthia mandrillaris]